MKVKRIICPKCGFEEDHREDVDNIHEYSEELIYRRCSECRKKITPEDRLLAAIFGEKIPKEGGDADDH